MVATRAMRPRRPIPPSETSSVPTKNCDVAARDRNHVVDAGFLEPALDITSDERLRSPMRIAVAIAAD